MKVSELIAELQKHPGDATVVVLDNEWLEYDRVKNVKHFQTELTTDPPTYFNTPAGKKPKCADRVMTDVVEVSVT